MAKHIGYHFSLENATAKFVFVPKRILIFGGHRITVRTSTYDQDREVSQKTKFNDARYNNAVSGCANFAMQVSSSRGNKALGLGR